jgi:arylsulfatase A-like enzyme
MRHVLGDAQARTRRWGVFVTLLSAALFQHGVAVAQLPNIVYILADDLGVGDVRSYTANSPVNTPNIDRIATAGMRFTDAHSPDSVCTPTRYGLLTGQYSWRTSLQSGVLHGFSPPLIPSSGRLTVAEMLKAQGYSTGMFGKWHLGMNWALSSGTFALANGSNVNFSQPFTGGPIDHGFDTYFGIAASANEGPYAFIRDDRTVGSDLVTPTSPTGQVYGNPSNTTYNRIGPIAPGFDITDVLPATVGQAMNYIASKANQANPFFAYIPLSAPHEPINPPAFAQGKTAPGNYNGDGQVDAADYVVWRKTSGTSTQLENEVSGVTPGQVTQEDYDAWRARIGNNSGLNGNNVQEPEYGDFLWSTDWAVGQILDKLQDPDGNPNTNDSIVDNTIVVFTADNGATKLFQLNSSPGSINGVPMRGEKGTLYEGGFRVPFLVQWPGQIEAGSVNSNIVEHNDFMATAAEIVDYTLPTNAAEDSRNILPELLGTASTPVRNVNVGHSYNGAMTIRQTDLAGNNWKLIFSTGDGSANVGPAGLTHDPKTIITDFTKVQLYNLTTDPGESTNLLSSGGTTPMQQKALQLQKLLQDYMYAGRSVNIPPRTAANDSVILVDFGENSLKTNSTGWNNAAGAVGTRPNLAMGLYDQGGGYMGIVLKTSWNVSGDNPGGVASLGANLWGDGAGENYPAAVNGLPTSALGDSWFVRNGNHMIITLENLDAHATYDFLFYGASGATGPEYSLFTVTGSNSGQALITPIYQNATQVAAVNGIMANAQSRITIDFEGRFANGSVGGGGFLNFMRIIEHLLEVPGDYNNDRLVDAADFQVWRASFGTSSSAADGNDDGIVDSGDYVVWRKAIASGSGAGAGLGPVNAVPEPVTAQLFFIALIFGVGMLPRRRRGA